ncbi:MAG: glycosyltransferase [Propionibacteriaceae bacterium]|nr:glycosyltransferase [Propionibacteriaceae bacterium]
MRGDARPAVLVGGLTGSPGGKEAFILAAFRLLRHRYAFTFLADRDVIAHEAELVASGAQVVRVASRRRHPFRFLRDVHQVIQRGRFHAVWLHQTVISTIEPLLFARWAGVPVRILHSHSSANMSGRVSGLLHRLQRPLARRLANRRFACSAEAARWFFGHAAWTFVPNVFDPAPFTFDATCRTNMRRALGLADDELAVIHVARLGPAKNHAFSLQVMAELQRLGIPACLLLSGDGPYRTALEAAAAQAGLTGCVRFLGQRSDVPDLLQAADVMILPSTFEGLPYVALEAQAAGLPLLLSEAVSVSADAGGDVRFVPLVEGPQKWARLIATVTSSPPNRGRNVIIGSDFDATAAQPRFEALLAVGEAT